jgi:hypothetical protein
MIKGFYTLILHYIFIFKLSVHVSEEKMDCIYSIN